MTNAETASGVPSEILVEAEDFKMAGKHICVTHVAGSSVKLMGNGAQHCIATTRRHAASMTKT